MKFIIYVIDYTNDKTGKGGNFNVAATDQDDAETQAALRFRQWELEGKGYSAADYTVNSATRLHEPQEMGK